MKREQAVKLLAERRDLWRSLGVKELMIFGSVARDQATDHSDVDILVEFSGEVGLFDLFALRRELERVLGTSVDLGRPNALRPELREQVLAEAFHVA